MTRPSGRYEYMSLDDFEELLADRPADEKWELLGGRVVRMTVAARWEHNRIVGNAYSALLTGLRSKGSDCRPFAETFWLKKKLLDLACFPDVMVRRGALPKDATSLEDPVVLVEVASPGSRQRDRWEKWVLYTRLLSLQHYVLIERDEVDVQVFDRVQGGFLQHDALTSLEDALRLPAIDFEMGLRDIYRDALAA